MESYSIEWIKNWRDTNSISTDDQLTDEQALLFLSEFKSTFSVVSEINTDILIFNGNDDNGALDEITGSLESGTYTVLNDIEEIKLINSSEFTEALTEAVGEEWFDRIYNGVSIDDVVTGKAAENEYAIKDYVYSELVNKAVSSKLIGLVSDDDKSSIWNRTVFSCAIFNTNINDINNIPKESYISMISYGIDYLGYSYYDMMNVAKEYAQISAEAITSNDELNNESLNESIDRMISDGCIQKYASLISYIREQNNLSKDIIFFIKEYNDYIDDDQKRELSAIAGIDYNMLDQYIASFDQFNVNDHSYSSEYVLSLIESLDLDTEPSAPAANGDNDDSNNNEDQQQLFDTNSPSEETENTTPAAGNGGGSSASNGGGSSASNGAGSSASNSSSGNRPTISLTNSSSSGNSGNSNSSTNSASVNRPGGGSFIYTTPDSPSGPSTPSHTSHTSGNNNSSIDSFMRNVIDKYFEVTGFAIDYTSAELSSYRHILNAFGRTEGLHEFEAISDAIEDSREYGRLRDLYKLEGETSEFISGQGWAFDNVCDGLGKAGDILSYISTGIDVAEAIYDYSQSDHSDKSKAEMVGAIAGSFTDLGVGNFLSSETILGEAVIPACASVCTEIFGAGAVAAGATAALVAAAVFDIAFLAKWAGDSVEAIIDDYYDGDDEFHPFQKAWEQFNENAYEVVDHSFIGRILDGFIEAGIIKVDPLILDLDNDGFNILDKSEGVYFDKDNNGYKERIDWTAKDAFLAIDRNGNGVIDNGSELFGDTTFINGEDKYAEDGFAALQQYDENGDGVINNEDRVFGDLKLWVDKNGNGISESSELSTLADNNISSISVNADEETIITSTDAVIDGTASFEYSDGTKGRMGSLWATANMYDTKETAQAESNGLNIKHSGNMPSLAVALDKDNGVLKGYIEQFNNAVNPDEKAEALDNILFAMSGAQEMAADSRGAYIDARKLNVIEKICGQAFVGANGPDPNVNAAKILDSIYDLIHALYL